jgi:hypothetical protein
VQPAPVQGEASGLEHTPLQHGTSALQAAPPTPTQGGWHEQPVPLHGMTLPLASVVLQTRPLQHVELVVHA